jgi:hypothetical protein
MKTKKVQDASLTAIANAIRAKGGTSKALEFPNEFVSAIEAISGGVDGDNLDYGDPTVPMVGSAQIDKAII